MLLLAGTLGAAEFLIIGRQSWKESADRTNWTAGQLADYERRKRVGDIVDVFDDGTLQNPFPDSPFYVVRITGVTKAQAQKYIEPYWVGVTSTTITAANGSTKTIYDYSNATLVSKRKYRVRVTDVPLAIRNQLQANRYVNLTWSQVRSYIRNKETNLDE